MNSTKLATIIECDPALSAKLLRLANSPLYCPSSEVKSITHSVSLIGLRRLRSFAMSVAGAAMFLNGVKAREQRRKLWNHSVGCAVVARSLADHVAGVDRDEVFLGGVFHDVGKLFFYDAVPVEYAEVDSAFTGLQLVEVEHLRFGTTHEEVGLTSARSWGLPNEIKAAIGWHHRPTQAEICPVFAHVVHAADALAKHWCIGSDAEPEIECIQSVASEFGLTDEQLESLETETRQAFEETMSVAAI